MANILVLDDEPDVVLLMQRVFQNQGHTVFGFTDEEEAIAFAARNRVDVAILDLMLKKIDGMEVLKELRKTHASMGAIIVTGYPSVETARQAAELGVWAYCVKPIEIHEIQRKLETMLASPRDKVC